MFKCVAGHVSKRGEPLTKIPLSYREKTYTKTDENGEEVIVGRGFEIEQEGYFCQEHAEAYIRLLPPE